MIAETRDGFLRAFREAGIKVTPLYSVRPRRCEPGERWNRADYFLAFRANAGAPRTRDSYLEWRVRGRGWSGYLRLAYGGFVINVRHRTGVRVQRVLRAGVPADAFPALLRNPRSQAAR